MAPAEKNDFIADSKPGIPTDKKNKELGAKLVQAPYVDYKIIRIERSEEDSGWYVYYTE